VSSFILWKRKRIYDARVDYIGRFAGM